MGMGRNVAVVKVENKTGKTINDIKYRHRYDEDIYEDGELAVLAKGEVDKIGVATYWTGPFRTGKDYWWIQFTRGGAIHTCKANFYCFLTSEDAEDGGPVILRLKSDEMQVIPPKSSSCKVRLYEADALMQLIEKERIETGISEES